MPHMRGHAPRRSEPGALSAEELIELAVGLSGGFVCTHAIPLSTGVDLVAVAIRLALVETPTAEELVPRCARAVAQRHLFPAPGRVIAVEGAAEAAGGEGIALLEVRVRPGQRVWPMTSHVTRGGVVIAVGDTRQQAVERAEAAAARVRIITQPETTSMSVAVH